MKTPTKAAAHCVYNLNYHIVNYHIVLVTKYRNRVLTGDIERFVKEQVPLICARYESSALGTSHLRSVRVICARYESSALGTSHLRSVRVICARYEWETLALEVMPEHVHLFVSAGPLTAPNTIAKTVKSILQEHPGRRRVPRVPDAAVAVFREFLTLKARRFWGSGLWSDGCYYGSAGAVSAKIIKCYIESQKDACVKDEVGLDNERTLMCGRTEDQSR